MSSGAAFCGLFFVATLCSIFYSTYAVTCYCDQSTELGLPSPQCLLNHHHCNSSVGCYLQRFYSSHASKVVQRMDCLAEPPDGVDSGLLNLTVGLLCHRSSPSDIIKCCFTDFCNGDIQIVLPIEIVPSPSPSSNPPPKSSKKVNKSLVSAISTVISILVLLLVLSVILITFLFLYRNKKQHRTLSLNIYTHSADKEMEMVVSNETSAVGTDLPYKVISDIKDIVKMNYQLSIGKFGTYYHSYYEGKVVVLKKFEPHNKTAWLQESMVYNKLLQPHDNILLFYESAMVASDAGCEFWLVTQYHKFGSLQDYLRQHSVTPQVLMQMTASICSGLAYLHSDRSCDQTKPPIAHCNLTSKNILVKNSLSCCIGDFQQAVFKHKNKVKVTSDIWLSTVRYMAPEVLDNSIDVSSFESFKYADIYALGLVMWEICNRTIRNGELVSAYQIPFQDVAFPEVSVEDMKTIVVTKKTLPTIPKEWNSDKLLCGMTKVMQECWYYNSTARPTAVYLKKKLLKMAQNYEFAVPKKDDFDIV